jgi:hypothetical protein
VTRCDRAIAGKTTHARTIQALVAGRGAAIAVGVVCSLATVGRKLDRVRHAWKRQLKEKE